MRRGTAILVVLALILAAGIVVAQRDARPMAPMARPNVAPPPDGDAWCMGMGVAERIIKQLNLTPDQVKSLDAIRKDFVDSTATARADIKTRMSQMKDLWMADPPVASDIEALADQIEASRVQVRNSAIEHAIQGLAVLTPAQRTQVNTWLKSNPHMMMGMGCGICCGAGMCGCKMGRPVPGRPGAGPAKGTTNW